MKQNIIHTEGQLMAVETLGNNCMEIHGRVIMMMEHWRHYFNKR